MSKKENTVRLHRVFKAPVEKVYRAFVDPDAHAQWIPPYGFVCKVHEMDVKVGGKYKMSFTNFTTGNQHSWSGQFLELVPNELVKYSDKFDEPSMPEQMLTTVTLKEVICGTEIHITQENIPPAIPAEMCYLGWQESLIKLGGLVEPDIKD